MIPEFSLPPTDNGDVARKGAMDVAEALVGLEAPGAEPGHGGWARTGDGRGKGLRGGQAWRHGNGSRRGEGLAGGGGCSWNKNEQWDAQVNSPPLSVSYTHLNHRQLQDSLGLVSILIVTAWVGTSGGRDTRQYYTSVRQSVPGQSHLLLHSVYNDEMSILCFTYLWSSASHKH